MMASKRKNQRNIIIQPEFVETRESTNITAVQDTDVSKALAFIQEHAREKIYVDDVVDATLTSRRLLEKRFQKILASSILKEIQRVRIEIACKALTNTDLLVAQIAEKSGFSSAVHMSVVFKKNLNVSPQAYRKRCRI